MKNVTLAIEDEVLEAGRRYAARQGTTLNALMRELLRKAVLPEPGHWIDQQFEAMDRMKADSTGKRWKREDLYDV
ncbi:MAG: hypothetical protein ACKV22_04640 [Bryobacteraceae bacterium]